MARLELVSGLAWPFLARSEANPGQAWPGKANIEHSLDKSSTPFDLNILETLLTPSRGQRTAKTNASDRCLHYVCYAFCHPDKLHAS